MSVLRQRSGLGLPVFHGDGSSSTDTFDFDDADATLGSSPRSAANDDDEALSANTSNTDKTFLTSSFLQSPVPSPSPRVGSDGFAALVYFACFVVPPFGVYVYDKHLRAHVKEEEDDDDDDDDKPCSTAVVTDLLTRAVSSCPPPPSQASKPPPTAVFRWSWSSAWRAVVAALTFSLPVMSDQSWPDAFQDVKKVAMEDDRYIMHPRFYACFRTMGCGAFALIILISFSGCSFSFTDPLLYTLRFWLVSCGAIATILSTHSEGGTAGYKARMKQRELALESIPMKVVLIDSEATHTSQELSGVTQTQPTPDANECACPQQHTIVASTALKVVKLLDKHSKQTRAAKRERRVIYALFLSLVRAVLAFVATANLPFSSLAYAALHLIMGFVFFAFVSLMEFELYDDERRWKIFNCSHSEVKAKHEQLPFYIPLANLPQSENIAGWFAIRQYFKDMKGKFDFARMEMTCIWLVVQIVSVAGLGVYWSYFHNSQSISNVYDQVLGENYLVVFDLFLCFSMIVDIVAAGLSINLLCAQHITTLTDEELARSFALSKFDGNKEAEDLIVDSIHQLQSLQKKLIAIKDLEKLNIYGFRLDEQLMQMVRASMISYALVASQNLFSRKVLHETPTGKRA